MKRLGLIILALSIAAMGQIVAGPGTGTQGTGASLTSTGITTANGDLVLVACSAFGQTISAPTDSKASNTWTQCANSPQVTGGTSRISLWWSKLVNGGASHTFTCHPAASADQGIGVQDFTGAASSPTDGANGGIATSLTPSSGNVTPAVANDVLVGAVTHDSTPTTSTGTGFTNVFIGDGTSSQQPVAMEYKILSGTPATAATWTLNVSNAWAATACAFSPASSLGPNIGLKGKVGFTGQIGIK